MKRFVRGVAAVAAAALTMVGVSSADAAVLDGVIKSVNVVQTTSADTGTVDINGTWAVPDSAVSGDTFTLDLPNELKAGTLSFYLCDTSSPCLATSPDMVATATQSGKTITFTLSTYADTHVNVNGSFHFQSLFDRSVVTTAGTYPLTFTSGTSTFNDSIDITISGTTDNPTGTTKFQTWSTTTAGQADFFLRTANLTTAGTVTLTDTPGAGIQIDCTRLFIRYGQWVNGSFVIGALVPNASKTVTCSPSTATVTVTAVPAGQAILMRGYELVTDPNLASYTNYGVGSWPGTPSSPTSDTLAAIGGGGTGNGNMYVQVGNYVWLDTNKDGIQDATEPGIGGVTLTLTGPTGGPVTDLGGAVVAPKTTDAAGAYLFANLPALPAGQHYTVTVTDPAGFIPTITGAGTTATDSSTGSATSTDLTANGQEDLTLDFGFVRPSVSVGDYVWVDTNKNGIQDSTEAGISGVTLTLTGPGGAAVTDILGNPVTTTTTDAAGAYVFANLPALPAGQHYSVAVTAPAGYIPTITGAGTTATDSSTGSATSGDLTTDGAKDLTLDFGFVRPSVSVGDYVWVDTNKNGIQDSTESGISGVTLTISRTDGAAVTMADGSAATLTTTTDANGAYSFSGLLALPAGTQYAVTVTNPSGYVPTITGAGTTATDSSNGMATSTDLTTDGAKDLTLDFGFIRPSVSVGDFVWLDVNHNGVQDTGEAGISGVTLTLTGPGGAAVTDVLGNPVAPVVTDAAGAYTFTNLPALAAGQSYTVTIDSSTVPAGYYPTLTGASSTDLDSSTGSAVSGDLTVNGAKDLTLDFGFWVPGPAVTIVKGDNLSNAADTAAAAVSLPTGSTTLVYTVTNAGTEDLKDVTVSDTVVTNGTVTGLSCTFPDGTKGTSWAGPLLAGATFDCSAVLSGVTGADGLHEDTATVTGTGTVTGKVVTDDNPYFATVPSVSVGDYVWLDANHNGVQDAGEAGIGSVTVTLTGPGGAAVTDVNGNPVTSTTTDATGLYTFTGLPVLPAGQHYTVTVTTPVGLYPTITGAGTTATDSSTGSAVSTDLTVDGAKDTTLDFGFFVPVSVGDFVWVDTNRDGIQDAGEPGIPGVVVTITNADGTPVTDVNGNPVTTTTTGANGAYTFTNLPPGTYTVTVVSGVPAGYDSTVTGAGTTATDSSTGSATSVVLTSGQSDTTLDFGFYPAVVSVGDYVWLDANHNGVQDAGEAGIGSVTVTLTGPAGAAVTDVNGNPVTSTTTDTTGLYTFTDLPVLPAGQHYTVTVTTPAGLYPTITGAGTTATDSSTGSAVSTDLAVDGAKDTTLDFGFFVPVSVGDFVWVDTNRDGIQDAGEPGIPGVVVTITNADGTPVTDVNGNPVTTTTTGANGAYTFTNLPPGTYTVTVVSGVPAGYDSTVTGAGTTATDSSTGSATSVVLTSGQSDTTLDFGFYPAVVSVGDYVWLDANHNGVQDAGEAGIGSVTVTLTGPGGVAVTDVNGNPVTSTTTDATGLYTFTDLPVLPAGQHYTVTVTTPAGLYPTITGAGSTATDSSTGSAVSTDLTVDGAKDTTLDFGFWKPTTDIVIVKGDAAGNAADTEADAVELVDGKASLVYTVTNGGTETLKDVKVSDAVVSNGTVTALSCTFPDGTKGTAWAGPLAVGASFDCTASLAGVTGSGGIHKDIATVTATGSVTGTPVKSDNPYHAVVPSVSVGDYVWLDSNHDGVQDAGEAGIAGVTVTLTGPTGAAVTDVNGHPVTAVVTDTSGAYTFADLPVLPAGQHYTVTVTTPAGLYPTITGAGSAATDSSTGSAVSTDLTVDGAKDTTLDFGFWKPTSSVVIVKGDAAGNAADTEADAVELVDGKASLVYTVTNGGTETLKDVKVSDAVVSNGTVTALSCTFPDGTTGTTWAGPLAVGASFDCTASLTGVVSGTVHKDVATVTATGTITGTPVTSDNPYFGKVTPPGAIDSGSVTLSGHGWLVPVGLLVIVLVAGCAFALRRRKDDQE